MSIEYLPRQVGFVYKRSRIQSNTLHIWDGRDTACRMWSTGGLVKRKYVFTISREGRKTCKNCVGALGYDPASEIDSTHRRLRQCVTR